MTFHYRNQELFVEDVPLRKIAEKTGTPVYIYSASAIESAFQTLTSGLKKHPHTICYAVKANSNLQILSLLAKQGAGLDLVSGGELYRALRVGVPGERIVFSGVGKTKTEITEALTYGGKGIYSFNVESASEYKLICQTAAELNKNCRVAFRFNPEVNARTHPYIATGLKKSKFGMTRTEILGLIRGTPHKNFIQGISCHIGSQILTLKPFEEAIRKTLEMVNSIEELLGRSLEFIDLGGGLGIPYSKEKAVPISAYCKAILNKLSKRPNTRLVLEPGRWLVGNAGVLVTQVLYLKNRSPYHFVILDAGMNDLIRPAMYESFHEIIPVMKSKNSKTRAYSIVGPVCESADAFAENRKLPQSLAEGDLLSIMSAGAYSASMSSHYNSRPKIAEVLVRGSTFETIRRPETYEDLISKEVLF